MMHSGWDSGDDRQPDCFFDPLDSSGFCSIILGFRWHNLQDLCLLTNR